MREESPRGVGVQFTVGGRNVMTLSDADVERYLDPRALLDALETGFRWLELGEVRTPPRPVLPVGDRGFSLAMSAWRPGRRRPKRFPMAMMIAGVPVTA